MKNAMKEVVGLLVVVRHWFTVNRISVENVDSTSVNSTGNINQQLCFWEVKHSFSKGVVRK